MEMFGGLSLGGRYRGLGVRCWLPRFCFVVYVEVQGIDVLRKRINVGVGGGLHKRGFNETFDFINFYLLF